MLQRAARGRHGNGEGKPWSVDEEANEASRCFPAAGLPAESGSRLPQSKATAWLMLGLEETRVVLRGLLRELFNIHSQPFRETFDDSR